MASEKMNREFTEAILSSDILDQSVDWIGSHMSPEDVFPKGELKNWAQGEGVSEVFDEKEIIAHAQAIGLEEVFPASALEKWADKNGYTKE